jgi:RNA polymerase sigma-70 factor (ECF subfamily)
LRAYLYTAVYNRSLNYIRDRKKILPENLPDSLHALNQLVNNQDYFEQEELKTKIYQSLQELPEGCRKIFIANRFEGKKYREIAFEQNISLKTVETQMSKALKILRSKLRDYLVLIIIYIYFL